MKSIIIPIFILILAVAAYVAFPKHRGVSPGEPISCTADAMLCPDGSSVGRVGPDCRFAPCPDIVPPTTRRDECQDVGGRWANDGLHDPICLHDYSDGGKSCTASSQCEGDCLASNGTVRGICQLNDAPYGCYQTIEAARAGKPVLCVD